MIFQALNTDKNFSHNTANENFPYENLRGDSFDNEMKKDANHQSPKIEKHDSFYATVKSCTPSGCILDLELENGKVASAFTYSNFTKGDRLYVTIVKTFEGARLPRVVVDTVIEYAFDSYNIRAVSDDLVA